MTATTHALLLLPPAFIDGIGSLELMMIMVLILVLFWGKKLPEFARGFGKVMAEVKKATSGVENEIRKATSSVEDEVNSAMVPLSRPAAQPPPPAAAAGDPAGSDPTSGHPSRPSPDPASTPWPEAVRHGPLSRSSPDPDHGRTRPPHVPARGDRGADPGLARSVSEPKPAIHPDHPRQGHHGPAHLHPRPPRSLGSGAFVAPRRRNIRGLGRDPGYSPPMRRSPAFLFLVFLALLAPERGAQPRLLLRPPAPAG